MVIVERERNESSYRKLARKYGISKSYAHELFQKRREFYVDPTDYLKPKKRRGRKKKLSFRDVRMLERSIKRLRRQSVNFTVMDVVRNAGFKGNEVHRRTFSSYLNGLGYRFLNARKKGLLTEKDKDQRLKYARKMVAITKEFPDYYKNHIAFYLDAVSFVHKYNPYGEANKPQGRIWRKRGEGLQITAKGSKEMAGGRRIHMLVAIAYGKGVIVAEQYEKMNGEYFSQFVKNRMNLLFAKSGPKYNGKRVFLMDNDPSQNSTRALAEIAKIEGVVHAIPPRSPDLNPIENVFHQVKQTLHNQAINGGIVHESLNDFTVRVKNAIEQIDVVEIDKTIDSVPKRLHAILKTHGNRTKY